MDLTTSTRRRAWSSGGRLCGAPWGARAKARPSIGVRRQCRRQGSIDATATGGPAEMAGGGAASSAVMRQQRPGITPERQARGAEKS